MDRFYSQLLRYKIYGVWMTKNFHGEKFKKNFIRDLSDLSCKLKGEVFFTKLGCLDVRTVETNITGEDLFFNCQFIPDLLAGIIGALDKEHSAELTTRTHITFFDSITWPRNDGYNVYERRV